MKKKALFITFEGPEGSGKSTQIRLTEKYLKKAGKRVLVIREPGSTRISEAIRTIILNPDFKEMAQETELLLYLAARAQLVREKILPALKKNITVICDRFEDSTLAYQGYGRGMEPRKIIELSKQWVRGALVPDITFLLNISPQKGMKRGGRHDRIEKASMNFHQKVQQGFMEIASRNPRRICVVDAAQTVEQVAGTIERRLRRVV